MIGQILAGLCLDGGTDYPIDAFSAERTALREPRSDHKFRLS